MDFKSCIKCNRNLPITNYYLHYKMNDGHINKCIDCCKKEAKLYYEKNKDIIKRKNNIYQRTEKGRESHNKSNRKYGLSDKGKMCQHKYTTSNKGKKALKRWKESKKGIDYRNKLKESGQIALYDKQKEAKRRNKNIKHIFSNNEWNEKVNSCNNICPLCNMKFNERGGLTLDHIIPISKVSENCQYTIDDVQPLCRICNSMKHDHIYVEDLFQ